MQTVSKTWKIDGWRAIFLIVPLLLFGDFDKLIHGLDTIVNTWKVVSFALVFVLYLIFWVNHRPDVSILGLLVLCLVLLVSTIINGGSMRELVVTWGDGLALVALCEMGFSTCGKEFASNLRNAVCCIFLVNFATVLVFPNGIWRVTTNGWWYEGYWVLGHRNSITFASIAAVFLSALVDTTKNRRISTLSIVTYLAAILTAVATWSATNVVVTFVMVVGSLIVVFCGEAFRIPSMQSFAAYAAVWIGVVLFQVQQYLAPFIETVLRRDATFTTRTYLWELSIDKISASPLIGYGVQLPANNGLTDYNPQFIHTHNGFLEVAYTGGIASLIITLFLLVLAFLRIDRIQTAQSKNLVTLALLCALVNGLTEPFFGVPYFFLLIAISYYLGDREHE